MRPNSAGVLAQQPRAHGVEGRGEHAARGAFAEQVGEPQPQLAGGAHAEGDGEDLARRRLPGGEQVRDAVGERAGLAGAGPGDDQQRPGAVADGLGLLGRQAGRAARRRRRRAGAVGRGRVGVRHGITSR